VSPIRPRDRLRRHSWLYWRSVRLARLEAVRWVAQLATQRATQLATQWATKLATQWATKLATQWIAQLAFRWAFRHFAQLGVRYVPVQRPVPALRVLWIPLFRLAVVISVSLAWPKAITRLLAPRSNSVRGM